MGYFWTFQMEVVVIAMSCDRVAKEAGKIVGVCHRIDEQLSSNSWESKEVWKLLMMVKAKRTTYTAAGYFVVNRETLFGLFGVATTYFIILVQLYQ